MFPSLTTPNTKPDSPLVFLSHKHNKIFSVEKVPKKHFQAPTSPNISLFNKHSPLNTHSINDYKFSSLYKHESFSNTNTPLKSRMSPCLFNHQPEDDYDGSSRNSLISISKEVFKYIKQKGETKGSEVTNHILKLLQSKGNKLNYKNIQRRVYDAINVMSAIGVIIKDKGNISYINHNNNSNSFNRNNQQHSLGNSSSSNTSAPNSNSTNSFTPQKDNFINIDEEIDKLTVSVKNKKNLLIQQCTQNYFYSKFIRMNQTEMKRANTVDKLDFPFYIITLNNESKYSIKQVDFNNRVVILSNQPFKIIDPENLIKFFVKNDFTKENVKRYFPNDLANYLIDNGLIETYFKNTTSNFECENSSNTFMNRNNYSYSFGQKFFEPIPILDSSDNNNNNNQLNSDMGLRKGSEDFSNFCCFQNSGFNLGRAGEDYSCDIIENPEKGYSLSHLSPYCKK